MFEVNPSMKIEVITGIKGRNVVVIDDFYLNPDEIRERAMNLNYTGDPEVAGGVPGTRGVEEESEVKEKLKKIYRTLCELYFPYREGINEKDFNDNWDRQAFMVNSINDEGLKEKPLGILPHQDWWENDESTFQFGSVIYLNKEEECAGGTNFYSHFGKITIPEDWQPQWVIDIPPEVQHIKFQHIYTRIKENNPYRKEYQANMKYNRMVLYEADILHGQEVDLYQFSNYNRINQVLFM